MAWKDDEAKLANLKQGIIPLKDSFPWDLTALEYTIFCLRYLLGFTFKEARKLLYNEEVAAARTGAVNNVNSLRYVFLEKHDLNKYSPRVSSLWQKVSDTPYLGRGVTETEFREWGGIIAEIEGRVNIKQPNQPQQVVPGEPWEVTVAKTLANIQRRGDNHVASVPTNIARNVPRPLQPNYRGTTGKICPRCSNKMTRESDHYGAYFTCMSCGHTIEEVLAAPPPKLIETSGKRSRQPSHGKLRL